MSIQELPDLAGVTRFEVIDHSSDGPLIGRMLVRYGVSVELSLQDGGRTLKVFLTDSPVSPEVVKAQMVDGWSSR